MSNATQPILHQTPAFAGALAIYIHWPFCKSKCPYCDFNSHVRESVDQERWKAALLAELGTMAEKTPNRRVTSVFFGGGTPSLMPTATAAALIEKIHALWPVASDIEITLEANPTSVEAHTFPDFKQAGINRVSLGVQSLNQQDLTFLGRHHSVEEALAAVELAAKTFSRYSFDLIYARPNQTLAAWEKELRQALNYVGSHLSLYQLTIEENTAFHHAYAQGKFALPDDALSADLYELTETILKSKSLLPYEVSNYAVPGEESRHNLAYWRSDDYIGIGPGAHGRFASQTDNGCRMTDDGKDFDSLSSVHRPPSSGAQRIATATLKSPERWLESVAQKNHGLEIWETLTPRQHVEETVMMGLRLSEGIDLADFHQKTGCCLEESINMQKAAHYAQENLVKLTKDTLKVTRKGRLLLNRLTAELLDGTPL